MPNRRRKNIVLPIVHHTVPSIAQTVDERDEASYFEHYSSQCGDMTTKRVEAVKSRDRDDDKKNNDGDGLLCEHCGKYGVTFTEKQSRSVDEGMTYTYTCSSCGRKWKR